jgi:hypothetical protein
MKLQHKERRVGQGGTLTRATAYWRLGLRIVHEWPRTCNLFEMGCLSFFSPDFSVNLEEEKEREIQL